jgi:hypothetical protein
LLSSRLPALALAATSLAAAVPAAAQATGQTTDQTTGQTGEGPENRRVVSFADVTASVGYSSNPLLEARSSIFGRLSVFGFHGWNNERGSTSLSAYVENTTYLQGGYGSKPIFRANAQADRAVSETVRVFGTLGITGDVAGQLTNRFTSPPVITPPDTNPPPETNPDVINLSGRQYRVDAQAGASISASARSSVSLTAGASRAFFTGAKEADYTTYQGSVGYSRQLSERTSVGTNLSLQRQDFRGSDYSNIVNPALTFRTKFAEDIYATGSVGLLAVYAHRGGESDHSYSPSFSGSVCKTGEQSSFCANLSRSASAPLSIGEANNARSTAITTNFNVSYSRQLGQRGTIRALVTASTSSRVRAVDDERFRTTYITGLVSYDRKIATRLFAGVSGGTRRVFQTGPDPRMDYNGNFYLRYRLGDLL